MLEMNYFKRTVTSKYIAKTDCQGNPDKRKTGKTAAVVDGSFCGGKQVKALVCSSLASLYRVRKFSPSTQPG